MKRAVAMSVALLVGIGMTFLLEGLTGTVAAAVAETAPLDPVMEIVRVLRRWVPVAGGVLTALVVYTALDDRL